MPVAVMGGVGIGADQSPVAHAGRRRKRTPRSSHCRTSPEPSAGGCRCTGAAV